MRDFSEARRVVIKIGTSCLTRNGTIDTGYVQDVCRQIAEMQGERTPLIVTSGAIGMGAGEIGISERITSITLRQACAAIGQPVLMQQYRTAFAAHRIKVAQVLLTADVLARRASYLNLRNSVESLLDIGVIPIFNENDCVATDEIGSAFGDNDTLSAYIASKVDADLLLMLSDIDALYDRDPRRYSGAKPIATVSEITQDIVEHAGETGSTFGTGGMATKIRAVEIARKAGCQVVLADGRAEDVVKRIIAGEEMGTLFLAEARLSNRQRWILNSRPAGRIAVDDGAMKALLAHKSLLPSGVVAVEGIFRAGDVVLVNDTVKLVTAFNSTELESIHGRHSSDIRRILGSGKKTVIARPEDMVILE